MFKLSSFLLLACVAVALAQSKSGLFKPEDECSQIGGLCVQKDQCPDGLLTVGAEELCPEQKELGAACCYGLPKSWTGCGQMGGECMSKCPEQLTLNTNDCPANTKCCVLV